MVGIDDHGRHAAARLAQQQMVDETPLIGAERDADDLAEFMAADLGVQFADGGECLALDDGEALGPAREAGGGSGGGASVRGTEHCGKGRNGETSDEGRGSGHGRNLRGVR